MTSEELPKQNEGGEPCPAQFRHELLLYLNGLGDAWASMPADMPAETRASIVCLATEKFLAQLRHETSESDITRSKDNAATLARLEKELATLKDRLAQSEDISSQRQNLINEMRTHFRDKQDVDDDGIKTDELFDELAALRKQGRSDQNAIETLHNELKTVRHKVAMASRGLESMKSFFHVSVSDIQAILDMLQ